MDVKLKSGTVITATHDGVCIGKMDDTIIVNGSFFIRNIRRNYIIQGRIMQWEIHIRTVKYRTTQQS